MSKDDKEIVSELRAALAERVGKERFGLWFGSNTLFDVNGRTLTIAVPNRFFQEWICTNFRRQIESACLATLGTCPALEFRIDGSLSQCDVAPSRPNKANGTTRQSVPAAALVSPTGQAADSAPRSEGPSAAPRKFSDLGSFVSGPTNRVALACAEMAARRPGQMTPLLIHGPTGVGKTHLLEGVWTAARAARRHVAAVYLSSEQFTTQFLEALRGSGLPNFRRKHRGVELLIIDDLQFFCGKRATQVELLYTVDTLLRQQRQVVLAADRWGPQLSGLLPELIARLESGMVCRVEPPDYATRLGIVAQMARRLEVHAPPDVQQFVASRLSSHARELSGALCRLRATSEAFGQPITVAVAEEALAEMIRHSGRVVRLPDIEKAVCEVFGLEPASLHCGGKAQRVSHPRMLAMWLARKHTRAALSEIGQFFGGRRHSTVVSAQKRVDAWVSQGRSLRLAERTWSVEEAIREVEQQLRAG